MKIWAQTIVHNEENFIWFAIMSVVDFVDKVVIWDTGSTDKTVEIIKEIIKMKGDKIEFKEVGEVGVDEFTQMRQKMLEQADCGWILILDGDEVWWDGSIKKVVKAIQDEDGKIDGIVVPFFVAVGDIYHHQEEAAGEYRMLGRQGHLTLRAINRKIPGLHLGLPYGHEGYFDENKKPIQEREKVIFLDAPFLHMTHLKRSSIKRKYEKYKYDKGIAFPENFAFPEILFRERPEIIASPLHKRGIVYNALSLVRFPFVYCYRRLKKYL